MTTQSLFLQHSGATYPIICGAMYPCSNPELVAAVSDAGGIGILQPITLTYACGYSFQDGLRYLHELTKKPIGMNITLERKSGKHQQTMARSLEFALDNGIRFFVTALGNPRWVVEAVHNAGGYVYHNVTSRFWAEKALNGGVDGFIAVNSEAGGHLGSKDKESLFQDLAPLGLPVLAAGGLASSQDMQTCLDLGYAGIQMGTRFIASQECQAHPHYKQAILDAVSEDIVATRRISGVPVSVIKTDYVQKVGTEVSWLSAKLLRHPRTKHLMRSLLHRKAQKMLPQSTYGDHGSYKGYWQAGKSVDQIHQIKPVKTIISDLLAEVTLNLNHSQH
ncbi:MAG: nitronate monooxygenase [Proteobacteria bacterium]|nr:nitronate monooxygenase [Pseudomonadota bacterium]